MFYFGIRKYYYLSIDGIFLGYIVDFFLWILYGFLDSF